MSSPEAPSTAPITPPPDQAMAVFRRLLRYSRRYVLYVGLAVLGMTIDAACTAGFTALMQPLLDEGFAGDDWAAVSWLPAIVLAIFIGRGLGTLTSGYYMSLAGRSVVFDMRRDLFEKLLYLPTPFFDREAEGGLISKLTYNVEQVAAASTTALTTVMRDSLYVAGFLVVMLVSSVRLTLVVIFLGPPIAWLAVLVSRRFRRYSRRIQESVGGVAQRSTEVIAGQQVVKLFQAQEREARQFEAINDRNRKQHVRLMLTKHGAAALVHLIAGLALAGIFFYATTALAASGMTPGAFIAFITAMLALLPSLKRLTNVLATLQQGIAAADSIFRTLDEAPEVDSGTRTAENVRGHVRFDDVSLRYEAADGAALDHISFAAEPGTVTAIVGRSGGGKSSLVNLLPRFYEPTGGHVFVDDVDVREYRLDELRSRIAVVSQQIVLFNESVASNIAYGSLSGAEQSAIEDAARRAGALEFIERLPQGLETIVGPGGVQLSGGQRQRIAIARAILLDAPILILDEATSALDTETERGIYRALEGLKADRTTLVI
ncbi:MAG: ABC transporter transmembrane domain-containing protein, partial [Pseudomonadota bacterium]